MWRGKQRPSAVDTVFVANDGIAAVAASAVAMVTSTAQEIGEMLKLIWWSIDPEDKRTSPSNRVSASVRDTSLVTALKKNTKSGQTEYFIFPVTSVWPKARWPTFLSNVNVARKLAS